MRATLGSSHTCTSVVVAARDEPFVAARAAIAGTSSTLLFVLFVVLLVDLAHLQLTFGFLLLLGCSRHF